jgi:predicted transcriptional regulator
MSHVVASMRTLIDLPDSQVRALAALCERGGQPRAALMRAAVAEYLERHAVQPMNEAFGAWGRLAPDGLDYQRTVRGEW